MARDAEGKGKEDSRELSIAEAIRALAAHNARADIDNEEQLTLFLKSWWSKTYNRPLKDPLLLSYTLEELLYEFYDRVERKLAEEERIKAENDKIEEDKERASLDWAEQEERKELEAERATAEGKPAPDPTKDPENIKWMEQQMAQAKAMFGEDFGDDINMDFDQE